jgi:hypothetical protein
MSDFVQCIHLRRGVFQAFRETVTHVKARVCDARRNFAHVPSVVSATGEHPMANEPFSKNPYRSERNDEVDRAVRTDSKLQPDPALQEGRANNSRVTLLALAAAVVLGLVFYGLNNSNLKRASTAPPIQTAQPNSAAPNSQSGVTTGSARHAGEATKPQSGNNGPNK